FAVIAPVELDLNELLKCAYAPPDDPDPLPDADGAGLQRLREATADLADPIIARPGGADRLPGYAMLFEVGVMAGWVLKGDGREPFDDWHPFRTLTSLADGSGGYLAPILARARSGRG